MLTELLSATLYAQEATGGAPKTPSAMELWLPLVAIIFIFYFMIIRPQSKRNKEQARMLTELKVGDEVVTNSGIIGRIKSIADRFVVIEISPNATMKVVKQYIAGLTRNLTDTTSTTSTDKTSK